MERETFIDVYKRQGLREIKKEWLNQQAEETTLKKWWIQKEETGLLVCLHHSTEGKMKGETTWKGRLDLSTSH